ncbi:MAG TPA: FHA domain-containing protein [Azoarcus taiwanensis]|uniref:FHA domain-containing protein n=1 Tax=Azoarcus taiwanensis TaxID=666964 RepID=A0A972F6Y2_9RHOO|nr:FHA domain-containing protein [Azoarcus taiwanensis]NMG02653.1 FHA domain-containing protein [Azoarcus taiwanensis]HRQ55955.1 FHA domain-containing protein [Azoarcus taiwanensis]
MNPETKSKKEPEGERAGGPQGTTLLDTGFIDAEIVSPSVDREGDVDRAALVGVASPFEGQRFALLGSKTTVGRHPGNDIVLPDNSVSSHHAWILFDDGAYRLMNVLSTNGSFVNERKTHDTVLSDGDRVRFGRAEFVFRGAARAGSGDARERNLTWVWLGAVAIIAAALAVVMAL